LAGSDQRKVIDDVSLGAYLLARRDPVGDTDAAGSAVGTSGWKCPASGMVVRTKRI
jgi:hypothetical protein